MSFTQPPFWAQGRRVVAAHPVSVVFTEPVLEPITVDQAKKYARIDGEDQNELLDIYRRSARTQVEHETGLALLTQTRDVYLDAAPTGAVLTLPAQSRPLQQVTSIQSTDTAGVVNTLAVDQYVVDIASGRIGLALGGSWPTDLRPFQPIVIRIVAGWVTVALMPAPLVHAVGLLAGFFANEGRDRFVAKELHDQYEETIAPYRLVVVA